MSKTETAEECISLVKLKNSSAVGMIWFADYYNSYGKEKKCFALFKAINYDKVDYAGTYSYFCDFKGIQNIVL